MLDLIGILIGNHLDKNCLKCVGSYSAVCWVFVQLDVMYIHTCIHTCILDLGSFALDLICILMLSL